MKVNSLEKFLNFLMRLESNKIHYDLKCVRGEAIMALISVPGERWEVEFFIDGHVEVEVFRTTAARKLEGEDALERLFANYSD